MSGRVAEIELADGTGQALGEARAAIEADPEVRAALVQLGSPDAPAADPDAEILAAALTPWAVPLVVAASGVIGGADLALAGCADVLLAEPGASFVLPSAAAGGAAREVLVRCSAQLPYRLVTALTMAGRPLSAERAHEVGFVVELAPQDELGEAARRWAESLAAVPPGAAAAIREAATEGLGKDLATAIAGRYREVERYSGSADADEAVAALLEGRRPLWRSH